MHPDFNVISCEEWAQKSYYCWRKKKNLLPIEKTKITSIFCARCAYQNSTFRKLYFSSIPYCHAAFQKVYSLSTPYRHLAFRKVYSLSVHYEDPIVIRCTRRWYFCEKECLDVLTDVFYYREVDRLKSFAEYFMDIY